MADAYGAAAAPGPRQLGPGPIDVDDFRDVIGRFVTGVTVVTTAVAGKQFAATVSALASLSLEPPMLLACLNRTSQTQSAIRKSRRFAVNILSEHQQHVARWCATKETTKLDAALTARGPTGMPVINDAVAYLECAVTDTIGGGTHTVFIGEVLHGHTTDRKPLVYYRGALGGFADILNVSQPPSRSSQRIHAGGSDSPSITAPRSARR